MYVPQIVLTSYSYHFPNVMMLAQVVVTSVILEGGRLLGFSSMLKYTLERYYFASERGRLPVYIFGWWCTNEATFRLFLLFALQRRECPTEGLILFILVSFRAAQARVMQYSPSPRSCYLLHENESCTLIGCCLEKECMSIWTSCVGTGSIVWLLARAGVKEALLYWLYLPNYSFHSLKENINEWHPPW